MFLMGITPIIVANYSPCVREPMVSADRKMHFLCRNCGAAKFACAKLSPERYALFLVGRGGRVSDGDYRVCAGILLSLML
jgi:hypothetical protein